MLPSGTAGLSALFGLAEPARFLDESWPGEPRLFHHGEATLPGIWRLPGLQSLEQFLGIAVPDTLFANLRDYDEEYSQVHLASAADAKKAFAARMGLSMEPDLAKLPELHDWIRAIHRDLGLAEQTYGRCNLYAIPGGGRTAGHFDQNINIVCQLTGEKTWHLAPNSHVANPLTRHTLGTPPDRSTAKLAKGPLPREMPGEGRIRVVLKRGSVLFVPRGTWHETTAEEDSLSLNFTFDQPSWARVLSSAICRRLEGDERWRGVAYGLRMEGPLAERAAAEFKALLQESGESLRDLRFEDLE